MLNNGASPEDTVTQIYAEKFAEEADRLSDGRIKITVYPNSVLGGDRELLESCYDGDIPFVVQNTAPQVNFIDDTAIFDAPCVFDDIEELRDKIDQPEFLSRMQESYRDAGYELLGYADQGFRVMSSNKEVSSFSDFKGQKIRTMEDPYQLSFWKKLKANPTPMSFSEVYIGLQQHTIDAQENPYEVIVSNRLYEQQDYIIETNHVPHLISLIVSEDFYKKLDIHVHLPEGATPKDGPSAGITMTLAMVSILTNRKVRSDIAMTGEITLRGRVLPIGGLKEKLLAALSHGIKEVLIPKGNEKDIAELPDIVKEGLIITPVKTMDEVLAKALV